MTRQEAQALLRATRARTTTLQVRAAALHSDPAFVEGDNDRKVSMMLDLAADFAAVRSLRAFVWRAATGGHRGYSIPSEARS